MDITQSFLIGDSWTDIEAAEKTGIKAFKINKNESILSICNEIITPNKH
ncbi:MAG: HAD hydrolase-like protein [Bacteroidales bacterium]|nr:HAD hydrolase-like protein [Bacteroidales bacterium]